MIDMQILIEIDKMNKCVVKKFKYIDIMNRKIDKKIDRQIKRQIDR